MNNISLLKCYICGDSKTLDSPVSFSLHSIPVETADEMVDAWQKATGINKNLLLQGVKVRIG